MAFPLFTGKVALIAASTTESIACPLTSEPLEEKIKEELKQKKIKKKYN